MTYPVALELTEILEVLIHPLVQVREEGSIGRLEAVSSLFQRAVTTKSV
jgi:hypothetical protein